MIWTLQYISNELNEYIIIVFLFKFSIFLISFLNLYIFSPLPYYLSLAHYPLPEGHWLLRIIPVPKLQGPFFEGSRYKQLLKDPNLIF